MLWRNWAGKTCSRRKGDVGDGKRRGRQRKDEVDFRLIYGEKRSK